MSPADLTKQTTNKEHNMKQRKQRGVVQILVLCIIVLVGLSMLARCDIEDARTDHETNPQGHTDEMETNDHRIGNNPARTDAVQ